jgi:hypothetical protein
VDDAGHVLGAVVVFRDVSEHKALIGELQRHRDHLEELVGERTRELDVKRTDLRAGEKCIERAARPFGPTDELRALHGRMHPPPAKRNAFPMHSFSSGYGQLSGTDIAFA